MNKLIKRLEPRRRFDGVSILLVIALAITHPLGCTISPQGQDLDGQDVEVVFLHTSDIHSRLIPYAMDVGETDEGLGLNPVNGPFGGVARLSAVVRQEREVNERFAYIETGDVFQGAPIFNSFLGEPEFRALTNLGVDAFTIGNHEFDNGAPKFVEKAIQFANFPMLAANYLLEDPDLVGNAPTGLVAQPYTILNLKGLKVGVIGLGDLGSMRSIFKGGNSLGITPLKTREVLQSYVDFLRPQVDLVVVGSHAGYHDDLDYIPRTEGIDIVFGGHLHIALNPPNIVQDCDIPKLTRERDKYICDSDQKLRQAKEACEIRTECFELPVPEQEVCSADCATAARENCVQEATSARYAEKLAELDADIKFLKDRGCHPRNVILVHSGAFLKYAGRLEVTLRQCSRLEAQKTVCVERDMEGSCIREVPRRCVGRNGGHDDWEVVAHQYKLIPMDKNLPDDPMMLWLLEPYILELSQQQLLTQVLGFTAERIKRFSRVSGDSPVGNMVAESMQYRNQVWADFAVTNSLGIRSDIVSGPIDDEQMTNVFPFENTLTVMYLSGYEVQEMMDFIAQRSANRGCQSQAQVSGITATLNCGGCPGMGENPCASRPYSGEACAQRVTIGGTGRPCAEDIDCARDDKNQLTGEICTTQAHPIEEGKRRCWLPISCTRSYRLATNDYIAKGGSGFQVLERNTTQNDLGISMRASAKDYMRSMPACSQNPDPALRGEPYQSIITDEDEALLKTMEQRALDGDLAGVNADFKGLRDALVARMDAVHDKWELKAYRNYLACTDDECPASNPEYCTGLAARQVKQCADYAGTAWCEGQGEEAQSCMKGKLDQIAECEALSRVRAALRCITLPCIDAREDDRLHREFKESTGSPAPDDPWPE